MLIFAKRHYMGKDLLSDRYGRYFEIPEHLAGLGHEVTGVSISYRYTQTPKDISERVHWRSINALPFPPLLAPQLISEVRGIVEELRPDIIWAGSDAVHCVIATAFSKRFKIPIVLDLYDNYESYKLTSAPMLKGLFIRACQGANGITTVGQRLKQHCISNYKVDPQNLFVLNNAITEGLFRPMDKTVSRETLSLPLSAKLIGTAGALTKDRGVELIFEAFLKLAQSDNDLYLVVAGQRDRTIKKYVHDRIIDLGILPLSKVPLVFNALDVAIISNIETNFGEFCFPQKFYEIASCETPLVASRVGEISDMLKASPEMMYAVGSVDELVRAIHNQIENPRPLRFAKKNSWPDRAIDLEKFFYLTLERAANLPHAV